jgi:hypothetical protein
MRDVPDKICSHYLLVAVEFSQAEKHQRWMYQIVADGAHASSKRGEGDAQSAMVEHISVSAASSVKDPTSSAQAVTRQEVVQTRGGASAVDDHLRLMMAGAVQQPRQMEVVRYHRGFRMPRTESTKFQHAVCLVDPRMHAFTRVSLAFGPASITDPFAFSGV